MRILNPELDNYPIYGSNPRIVYSTNPVVTTEYERMSFCNGNLNFRYPVRYDAGGLKVSEGPWELDHNLAITSVSPASVDPPTFTLTIAGTEFGTSTSDVELWLEVETGNNKRVKVAGSVTSVNPTQVVADFDLTSLYPDTVRPGIGLLYLDRPSLNLGADVTTLTINPKM